MFNKKNGYYLQELKNGKSILCKILCEYDKGEKKEAEEDLINLLSKNTTEKEIIKKSNKKG